MTEINWSVVNTALLLGTLGYLWRQSQVVGQVRQSLLGFEGQGGALEEIRKLRVALHDLTNTVAALQGEMELRRSHRERVSDA